jgi:uncharacterized iron-regulated membrane protein
MLKGTTDMMSNTSFWLAVAVAVLLCVTGGLGYLLYHQRITRGDASVPTSETEDRALRGRLATVVTTWAMIVILVLCSTMLIGLM